MAKARALDRRRKSIRNIRKITRTMELISTAQFKRAMDRAIAATAYTRRITALVGHLAHSGLEVTHPLLQPRPEPKRAILLVLTANRGLCGGYNAQRPAAGLRPLPGAARHRARGPAGSVRQAGHLGLPLPQDPARRGVHPFRGQAELRRGRRAGQPLSGRFHGRHARPARRGLHEVRERQPSAGGGRDAAAAGRPGRREEESASAAEPQYEFLPSAASIFDEVVPTSFKVKLFKCFLDAAVSEQIARMVAMKAATENADSMISHLSMAYNRARQGQITGELLEIIGGAEALNE